MQVVAPPTREGRFEGLPGVSASTVDSMADQIGQACQLQACKNQHHQLAASFAMPAGPLPHHHNGAASWAAQACTPVTAKAPIVKGTSEHTAKLAIYTESLCR